MYVQYFYINRTLVSTKFPKTNIISAPPFLMSKETTIPTLPFSNRQTQRPMSRPSTRSHPDQNSQDPCSCCLPNDLFLPPSLRTDSNHCPNKENESASQSPPSPSVQKNKKTSISRPKPSRVIRKQQPSRASKKRSSAPPPPLSAASPNKRTRSQRLEDEGTIENSVLEQRRIHKIIQDFKSEDNYPCSVFGLNRMKVFEHEDFLSCSQCVNADNDERSSPELKVNRKRAKGPYKCAAWHSTNLVKPTHRISDDDKNTQSNPRQKKNKKKQTKRRTSLIRSLQADSNQIRLVPVPASRT